MRRYVALCAACHFAGSLSSTIWHPPPLKFEQDPRRSGARRPANTFRQLQHCTMELESSSRLGQELAASAIGPRVVRETVANPVGDRWMAIEQEDVQPIWFRIREIDVT